jgi:hypothetical protein
MATSTRTVTLTKTSLNYTGENYFNEPAQINNAAPDDITEVVFNSGNSYAATVTGPSGSNGAEVLVPASYSGTITLKGVTGDTGVAIAFTPGSFFNAPGPTFFLLLTSPGATLEFFWY